MKFPLKKISRASQSPKEKFFELLDSFSEWMKSSFLSSLAEIIEKFENNIIVFFFLWCFKGINAAFSLIIEDAQI